MKSYLDLIGKYGKIHRKKNRVTIICISVAVCLITAIFGLAGACLQSQTLAQIKSNGNWHVSFKDIGGKTAELIGSRVDVAHCGWIGNIGSSDGYTIQGKKLAISGADEDIAGEMGLSVTDGRYPQNGSECLLDRQALEQFSLSIGDNASITLPDGKTRIFTVVGTYGDFSNLKTYDAHGLVITYETMKGLTATDPGRFYVQFKNGTDMRGAIDEIKSDYNFTDKQVSENTVLLGMLGQSRDSFVVNMYMSAAVLAVLVLAAGVLMIAGSFNMSVTERIQFFGLLRCLGASKKQVRRFVLTEGVRFSLKGIPIGLLSGTVIVWISCAFLKYVNAAYFSEIPLLSVSWISLFAGIAVGFITVILASLSPCRKAAMVSPLSAVSGNISTNAPKSKTAVKAAQAHIEIAMGVHHAFQSKKNILLMTGSFAISIIIFLSFGVLVNFMKQALKPLKPYTPDISVISGDNTNSLDTTLLEKIKSNPEVKRAYGRMFAYDVPVTNAAENGKITLISYEENQFGWTKGRLVSGSSEEAQSTAGSVLVVYSDDLKWKVGDTITLQLDSGEKKVKIAGILSDSPFSRTAGTQNVICSEKTFQELTGGSGYTIIDIQLQSGAGDETVSQIRSLTTSNMTFSDRRQSNSETKAAYYSFAIFVYGFLAVIALIAFLNIINSMNNSVSGRMGQYGVMRAVGMSGKQLHRMAASEAFAYAVCGCLAGCIFGLPLHKYVYSLLITSKWGLQWQLPYSMLAVIAAITVIAAFISIIRPVREINRMAIVNVVNAK